MRKTDKTQAPNEILPDISEERYARSLLISSLAMIFALLIGAVLLFIQLDRDLVLNEIGIIVILSILAATVLLNIIAAVYSYRRQIRSSQFAFYVGILLLVVLSALFPAIGSRLGVIIGVVLIVLATQVASQRTAALTVMAGILLASICILFELYPLPFDIVVSRVQLGTPFEVYFIALLLVFHIFRRFRALPLSLKLVIFFLLITILSSGAITYFSQTSTRRSLATSVGNSLHSLAKTQANAIGDLLRRQVDAILALSIGDRVQDWTNSANRAYIGDIAAISAKNQEFDRQWVEAYNSNNIDHPLVQAKLENPVALDLAEFSKVFPEHIELILTDRYGALIAANRMTSDYVQSDETWWQSSYMGGIGAAFISGAPNLDQSTGTLAIMIVVPVRDVDTNEVIGILRTTYALDELFQSLMSSSAATGATDLFFSLESGLRIHSGNLIDYGNAERGLISSVLDSNFIEGLYDGNPSLISTAPVDLTFRNIPSNRPKWTIVSYQGADQVYAAINTQLRDISAIIIIIINLVAMGAILLAQIIATPILRLNMTAEQVRKGNLDARVSVKTGDEIGQLATTFNDMTAQLKTTVTRLEQIVSERTRELTLAGTVGRSLSQERNLERLLRTAVELIRSSFDLYYVQIYLMDTSGRNLILRAGSGSAGAELLRRGHRLPAGTASINGTAVTERRAVIVSDTQESAIFRPNPLLPDTRSEVSVPLLIGTRVMGVLDLQSSQAHAFSEANLAAIQALAGQLAIAVENAILFSEAQEAKAETERQISRLTKLSWQEYLDGIEHKESIGYEWDSGNLNPLNLQALQDIGGNGSALVETPIEILGEPVGTIRLEIDPNQQLPVETRTLVDAIARQVARQVDNLRLIEQADRYRLQSELAARQLTREGWREFLREQESIESRFVYRDGEVKPEREFTIYSDQHLIREPVQVRGVTIGEMIVAREDEISENDRNIIRMMAERLGIQLDSLRLTIQTHAALETTVSLNEITATANRSLDIHEVLQEIIHKVRSMMKIDAGLISLFEMKTRRLVLDAYENLPEGMVNHLREKGFSNTPCELVHRLERTLKALDLSNLPEDLMEWKHILERPIAMGFHAYLGIPLESKGRVLGTMCLFHKSPVSMTEGQISLLQAIGQQVGVAIENSQLFAQTQEALNDTQTLYQIIAEMNAAQSYDDILRGLAWKTILQRADRVLLMGLFDTPLSGTSTPEWIYPVASQSKATMQLAPRYPISAFEASPGTIFTGQPVILKELARDNRIDRITRTLFQEVFHAKSSIILPLMLGDQMIGFIQGYFSEEMEFPDEDIQRLIAVAGQAAIAVQSRSLLEQAQARARQEQRIREVTSKVFEASDVDSILRRAVEQVGRVLGLPAYIYLGDGINEIDIEPNEIREEDHA